MLWTFSFAIWSWLFFEHLTLKDYLYQVELEEIIKRVRSLEEEVEALKLENAILRERPSYYETPKNSRNSSIPPGKDENRPKPNQSSGRPSGKKPGGQFGRKGKTLEMTKNPDEIVDLGPGYRNFCGSSPEA